MSSLENRGNGSWRLTISDLLTLYGLRHTAASLMIAEGLPIRDVAAHFKSIKKEPRFLAKSRLFCWCTRQESNLWPSESESDALSN